MSLSDWETIYYGKEKGDHELGYPKFKVREAVKDLKEDIIPNDKHIEGVSLSIKQILKIIDKHFGPKLVNGQQGDGSKLSLQTSVDAVKGEKLVNKDG